MRQLTQPKRLFVALILLAILISLFSTTAIAFACPLNNDDFDIVFLETTKELYDTDADELYLTANKEPLLDIRLNPLGYVYDFYINGSSGYAILILIDDEIIVAEYALDVVSPYSDMSGNRIYVNYLTYLREDQGEFYVMPNNTRLPTVAIEALTAKAYCGNGSITYSEEYITYISKNVNKKNLTIRHPSIVEVGGLSNACAPIAGANLIQYWDRFCENLIPNYTSYTILNNQYLYKSDPANLDNIVIALYTDMSTNVNNAGTTETQFKNGLRTFCSRQGYGTVNFNSCMSWGKFNYDLAKQRIDAGQPLAIFVDTFTAANISESDTDYIAYLNGNGCHVMAGFGYKEISYVLTSGAERTDYYIAVAAGYTMFSRAYYNINLRTTIDDVFGVVIS